MDEHVLYRAIKNETTPEERLAVDAWRRESPSNEARYQELRTLLQATARQSFVASEPPPVLEVLEVASRRERSQGRRTVTRRVVLSAASIAALLLAGVALDRSGVFGGGGFGFEEMVTGENQTATVALRDGSVMRLAPRSHARFRVRDGSREVYLNGRAYFAVAKRNGLPFMVRTAGGDVTVLGTQFDVSATNNDVRLVVIEGRVALSAARGGQTRVEHGEAARIVEGQLLPTVQLTEARTESRWVGRFLAFRETPLTEAAKEIEQAYGAKVVIADTTLAHQTITNWFSDRSLDEVVRVVCAIVDTKCSVHGTEVTIGQSPH